MRPINKQIDKDLITTLKEQNTLLRALIKTNSAIIYQPKNESMAEPGVFDKETIDSFKQTIKSYLRENNFVYCRVIDRGTKLPFQDLKPKRYRLQALEQLIKDGKVVKRWQHLDSGQTAKVYAIAPKPVIDNKNVPEAEQIIFGELVKRGEEGVDPAIIIEHLRPEKLIHLNALVKRNMARVHNNIYYANV